MASVRGCHIVGSVPLADTETVLRACANGMPNRLKRMPDGETGSRHYFTRWQMSILPPFMSVKFEADGSVAPAQMTRAEIENALAKLKDIESIQTGYDVSAIDSYRTFASLKKEGVISKHTKFQVSLPTAPNVVGLFVKPELRLAVEPIYEAALYAAMHRIQDAIPHEECAIQIDLAVDTAYWEEVSGPMWQPYFGERDQEAIKERIVEYTVRMIRDIDSDVEVGLHNCYGDLDHRHFLEPDSLAAVSDRTLRIVQKLERPLDFVHFPVAKSALDHLDTYLAPLRDLVALLKQHNTDLYLGVVHHGDEASTRRMIESAQRSLGGYPFGVATECGWGRTPSEQIEGIMALSKAVSDPLW